MANRNNTVQTRFTTGKVRLTYAFLWKPRPADEDNQRVEKFSTSLLIPKTDQQTIQLFNAALQNAIIQGQQKGLWGAALPSNFKVPLRDGDAECAEKGEEYAGHWFLNASSTRRPQIVDINRNDIWEESDVYSGCYARLCSRSGVPPARSGPGSRRVSGGNGNTQKRGKKRAKRVRFGPKTPFLFFTKIGDHVGHPSPKRLCGEGAASCLGPFLSR